MDPIPQLRNPKRFGSNPYLERDNIYYNDVFLVKSA